MYYRSEYDDLLMKVFITEVQNKSPFPFLSRTCICTGISLLTRPTTKSLDVLHSFLPQPLNILDIIDISIGQISILLHYGALQISTLPLLTTLQSTP